jgi:hypothetical protein
MSQPGSQPQLKAEDFFNLIKPHITEENATNFLELLLIIVNHYYSRG